MKRSRPPALTLAETLVSCAIMALLGLILLQIYLVSQQAYSRGSGQIALQQRARTLMEVITPLIQSAVPPHEGSRALFSANSASLAFYVPDKDFLPRSPKYILVGIYHNDLDRTVRLENSVTSATDQDVMFRSRELAREIYDVRFGLPTENTVRIGVDLREKVRAAGGRVDEQTFQMDGLIQVPYYSKN